MTAERLNRRVLLGGAAAALGAASLPALAQDGSTEFIPSASSSVRNNISSFRMLDWRGYFTDTRKGAVLVDITSRALHYWSEDQSIYRLYPTSVPLSEELTRRGRADDQPLGPGRDRDRMVPSSTSPGQQHLGQRVLQLALDHPLQGPRAEDRIIAFVRQPGLAPSASRSSVILRAPAAFPAGQLDLDDPVHVAPVQPVEDDLLVQTVQEFRPEVLPHRLHHLGLGWAGIGRLRAVRTRPAPQGSRSG
jgi:hypothetical protein